MKSNCKIDVIPNLNKYPLSLSLSLTDCYVKF